MAAAAQSARVAAVLLAVAERLRSQLRLDSSMVRVCKRGGYKVAFAGEAHYRVRPVRGLYFGDAGAGHWGTPVTRTFAIDCWVRSGLDAAGEDEIALTEEEFGAFDREEEVAIALIEPWVPANGDGEPLTVEPLHFVSDVEDADAPEDDRARGYLVSTLYVEAKYVLRATVS